MARENNFLIGNGERLTTPVLVPTGGQPKRPAYSLDTAVQRLGPNLSTVAGYMRALPQDACPRDQAMAVLTMHPRFVSKSDFPAELLRSVGLRAVGSRSKEVVPE